MLMMSLAHKDAEFHRTKTREEVLLAQEEELTLRRIGVAEKMRKLACVSSSFLTRT
ncbi:hypothetical protein YC2023_009346 [Brassica napus]